MKSLLIGVVVAVAAVLSCGIASAASAVDCIVSPGASWPPDHENIIDLSSRPLRVQVGLTKSGGAGVGFSKNLDNSQESVRKMVVNAGGFPAAAIFTKMVYSSQMRFLVTGFLREPKVFSKRISFVEPQVAMFGGDNLGYPGMYVFPGVVFGNFGVIGMGESVSITGFAETDMQKDLHHVGVVKYIYPPKLTLGGDRMSVGVLMGAVNQPQMFSDEEAPDGAIADCTLKNDNVCTATWTPETEHVPGGIPVATVKMITVHLPGRPKKCLVRPLIAVPNGGNLYIAVKGEGIW